MTRFSLQNVDFITTDNSKMMLTSLQPSNAGGFRRLAFTKPINDKGKQRKEQANPALRLPEGVGRNLNKLVTVLEGI